MSKGGGKGGGKQTVQQNADPWSGAQPYLRSGMSDLESIYRTGSSAADKPIATPPYYPGSTVAQMNPYTEGAINAQALRGIYGSPLMQSSQDLLTSTMQGDFLNAGNPYFSRAMEGAIAPVQASVDSAFSSAGRYGSAGHADQLARSIGDITSRMAMQNYEAERNRQNQGMFFAPQLAQQDYFDINQLGAAGSMYDAYNQSLLNADIDRWNYNQDADWRRTQDFLQTIGMNAPTGSTTTQKGGGPSGFQTALGTGMGLLGLGNMFGLFGGAGLFSDERLKTDIKEVGALDNGLPIYSYRYIWGGPVHVGVMAQDALEVKPEAVGAQDGFLTVNYDLVTEPTS